MSATTKIVKLESGDKIPASLAKTIIKDMDPKQELGLLPSQTKEFRDDIPSWLPCPILQKRNYNKK